MRGALPWRFFVLGREEGRGRALGPSGGACVSAYCSVASTLRVARGRGMVDKQAAHFGCVATAAAVEGQSSQLAVANRNSKRAASPLA